MSDRNPNEIDEFLARNPWMNNFLKFAESFTSESERGAVFIAAAMLEDALGIAIRSRLVDCAPAKKKGLIGTFGNRIEWSLALGIISETEYQNLQAILEVRNQFAHRTKISFPEPDVHSQCARLVSMTAPPMQLTLNETDNRIRFNRVALTLIFNLHYRAHRGVPPRLKYISPEIQLNELRTEFRNRLRDAMSRA